MSNIDELEEYDAELELRLKKEYADVYGLFRYCVLTQEATYLCNQLDLQIEHQPSYPMIHVAMEDVWVWDKNRPTRIIPRTDIHTTQDVTIEELRPPESTPAARAADGVAHRMLLAVDVGNTQTHLGLWRGDELAHTLAHRDTRPLRTSDDLAVQLDGLLALRDLDTREVSALVVSSTVPVLAAEWTRRGRERARGRHAADRPRACAAACRS